MHALTPTVTHTHNTSIHTNSHNTHAHLITHVLSHAQADGHTHTHLHTHAHAHTRSHILTLVLSLGCTDAGLCGSSMGGPGAGRSGGQAESRMMGVRSLQGAHRGLAPRAGSAGARSPRLEGGRPRGGSAFRRAVPSQLLPLQQTWTGWECEQGSEGQPPGGAGESGAERRVGREQGASSLHCQGFTSRLVSSAIIKN